MIPQIYPLMKSRALPASWVMHYAHGWRDKRTDNKKIEATESRITEVMEDLTSTRTGEILNKGVDSPQTGIRARAHLTDARHLLKRSNAGHVVNWDIMHRTVPQLVLSSLSRQDGQNELSAGRARRYGLRRGSPRQ